MSDIEFTRINNDVNGNPRYVVHFLHLLTEDEKTTLPQRYGINFIRMQYEIAVKRSHGIGGRKYHTKSYGGGIVFQSYNVRELEQDILRITGKVSGYTSELREYPKIKDIR